MVLIQVQNHIVETPILFLECVNFIFSCTVNLSPHINDTKPH
jgi:hypothetical protein